MANDETNAELKPLHVRVCDAEVGDVGWVWFDDEWRAARILENGAVEWIDVPEVDE